MHTASTTELTWRKSTYSGNGTECVEVSDDLPGTVPIRDSKRTTGPNIMFSASAWAAFVGEIHAERIS
ncbi:DUF397 domain-containing protein [Streptomyces hesseae]|uniref:DUF397 domain-containing protein n=1 Tax=Streptomyces hesseae TaxID=3075519 RepID=A0ABU2SYT6_9ACTN|nr:DUF397 domain-containing protein [Streptomyces sp. DSM 40473]MDT0453751.1 DUF397 domain-containing protein [Streptomyces sp. DSM 40473]